MSASVDARIRLPLLALVAAAAVAVGLAGCVTTETVTTGASSGGATAPASSTPPDTTQESELRRRARIRVELAASYYQQGNYPVALQELHKALEIDPDYALAHGMMGLVQMDLGQNAQADASFQRALRLAPSDSDILNNYGWFLCQTGRPRESIDYFMRAVRNPLYRTPSRPYHNAGICALRMGDERAAEDYFLRSLQIDPRNAVAMYNLGEVYLKRGDLERARLYADRLLSSYQPTAQTLWLAVRVEHKAGNRDTEASLASRLKRLFPTSLEAAQLSRGEFGD